MNMLPPDDGAWQYPPLAVESQPLESQLQEPLPYLTLRKDSQAPLLQPPAMAEGLLPAPKLRKKTSVRRLFDRFRSTRQHNTSLAVQSPTEHDLAREYFLEYVPQPKVPSSAQKRPSTPLLPAVFENAKSTSISSSDYSVPPHLRGSFRKRSTSTTATSISESYFKFALPEKNEAFQLLPTPHRRTSSTPANFESPRAPPPLPLKSPKRMTTSHLSLFPDARFSESHDPQSSIRDTLQTRRLSLAHTINSPTFSSAQSPQSPTFSPQSPTFSPQSPTFPPQSPTFSPTFSKVCTPLSPTFSTPFSKVCTPHSPTFPSFESPSAERYLHRPLPDPPALQEFRNIEKPRHTQEPIQQQNPLSSSTPSRSHPHLLRPLLPASSPPKIQSQPQQERIQKLKTKSNILLRPHPNHHAIQKQDISAPLSHSSSLSRTFGSHAPVLPRGRPESTGVSSGEVDVDTSALATAPSRRREWMPEPERAQMRDGREREGRGKEWETPISPTRLQRLKSRSSRSLRRIRSLGILSRGRA